MSKTNLFFFDRTPILGFIGNEYQRFHIRFISVVQNYSNRYEYFVYGKTKVKDNICVFQGTLTIKEAYLYDSTGWYNHDSIKIGRSVCEIIFFEDSKQKSAGCINGTLTSGFVINETNNMEYDATLIYADGFCNNQFTGNWTSYKTGISKKCNFGDYRIPECNWINGCDIGAAFFSINPKYIKNGWEGYYRCMHNEDLDKGCNDLNWAEYKKCLEYNANKACAAEYEKWRQ